MAVTGTAPTDYRARSAQEGDEVQSATRRRKLLWDLQSSESNALYGVRSAVTNRASRITVLEPATRRQDASKFGQA